MSADLPSLPAPPQVFRPLPANTAAGFVLALLAFAVGAAGLRWLALHVAGRGWRLPLFGEGGELGWFLVGLAAMTGLTMLLLGLGLVCYSALLLRSRVEVSAAGLLLAQWGESLFITWAEVAAVRETVTYERPPILHGPAALLLPKQASVSYAVRTAAGVEQNFHGDNAWRIGRFGAVLRSHAARLGVPWERVEVQPGFGE